MKQSRKMKPCYGYANEQPCQFDATRGDFCPAHDNMYAISICLSKKHPFFDKPKVFKLEYRYKLQFITSYRYMSQMYTMEKCIEQKLARFKHFFDAVKIQRAFKRAISDPNYQMCKARLLQEFTHLGECIK
jgi:hypothetical protein